MPVDKTRFTARQSSPSSRLSPPLAAARAPRRMRILRLVPVVFTQRHIPNVNPRPRASSSSPIVVIPHRHRIASHRRARTNIRRRVHRPARGFTTAKVKKRPRRRRRPASRRSSSTARRYRRSRRHSRARRERRRRHRHRCHHHHRHRPSVFVTVAARSSVSRLPSPVVVVPRFPFITHSGLGPSSRRPTVRPTDRSTDRPFDLPRGLGLLLVRPSVRPIVRSSDRPIVLHDVCRFVTQETVPHNTHTPKKRVSKKKKKETERVVYLFVVV